MTSTCGDSPTAGVIGCGASYGGEVQHCVARVAWSTHPDGRAHITARLSTIDRCWRGGIMVDPATLGFVADARGVWRQPMDDEARARFATATDGVSPIAAATPDGGYAPP